MPSNIYELYIEKIMDGIRILPIHSDPCKINGDGDSYNDIEDIKPLSSYNNGTKLELFSKDNLDVYELYQAGCDSNFTNEQWMLVREIEDNITLIQKSLEKLGYLNMVESDGTRSKYGTFGGRTRAAIQLYQLNHGFVPLLYGEIGIDNNTFSNLVNNAVNHGMFDAEMIHFPPKDRYIYLADNYSLNSKYYSECRSVPLPITKEFHDHSYECGKHKGDDWILDFNISPLEYCDSEYICFPTNIDWVWMISKVKNNAKYDIKVKDRWNDFMNEIGEKIYFYGSGFKFIYQGEEIDAEGFGNILFGTICNAGGYGLNEILAGGSVYSLIKEKHFDNAEDKENIMFGYEMFESKKNTYSYLH